MIHGKLHKVSMTNFLAIHRKLRGKKMANLMITEALRRNRANGYPIGFYHSANAMPTPFLTSRSCNRLILTDKLIDCRYASLPINTTRKEFAEKYKLPAKDKINIKGTIRPMEPKDVNEVLRLYKLQCEKHAIHLVFTKEHIKHHMLPKPNIVMTYVVVDTTNKDKLTDFMSFTYFHQTILNKEELKHKHDI